MRTILIVGLALVMGAVPATAAPRLHGEPQPQSQPQSESQTPADVWRTLAGRIEPGTRVRLELRSGQRFTATLIDAGPDAVLLQPRTRIAVPAQRVPYDAIVLLARDEARGLGAGKAVLLGAATGGGVFFGLLLLLFASVSD